MHRSLWITAVAGLALAGAGAGTMLHRRAPPPAVDALYPESRLPAFLDHALPEIRLAYRWAAAHPEVLTHVPCFCGCMEHLGHRNNEDCFVRARRGDRIEWEPHAAVCGECVSVALLSMREAERGVPVARIRAEVERTYRHPGMPPPRAPLPVRLNRGSGMPPGVAPPAAGTQDQQR